MPSIYHGYSDYRQNFTPHFKRWPSRGKYRLIPCAFDIETTAKDGKSYMYIAQIGVGDDIILCRTWEDVGKCYRFLCEIYKISKNHRVICWIHNFGYEFSYIKRRVTWATRKDGSPDIFALAPTKPVRALSADGVEFRCSYQLSGFGLAALAKNYCKTQKLVGDLDYKQPRNSKTILSPAEEAYCINDVEILLEYSRYLYDTFPGKIPLTKTGIVRQDLKNHFKSMPKETQQIWRDTIRRAFPSEDFYKIMMRWLYQGGYVHANYRYIGCMIEDLVESFDFKSAYPAACFEKLPYIFKQIDPKYWARWIVDREAYATIIEVKFSNIIISGCHAIYSEHKALKDSRGILSDNGRVREAEVLHCYLTELDFDNFLHFYRWDKIEVIQCWISKKHYLPPYVMEMVHKYYNLKNTLPKGTAEYASSKVNLNSIYGMMVTGLFHLSLVYDEDTAEFDVDTGKDRPYYRLIQGQILLPQWGVWITAICRHNLLSKLISKMGSGKHNDAIYSDTDSAKVIHPELHREMISQYNDEILQRNYKIKKQYGYDIGKLGIFDDEGGYYKFKTLGCKRYCYTDQDGFHAVIAGLPKDTIDKYCRPRNLDKYLYFDDKMQFMPRFSQKLGSRYTDDRYTDIIIDKDGNAEQMTEESGCCLVNAPFTMSMTEEFKRYTDYYHNKNKLIIGKRG